MIKGDKIKLVKPMGAFTNVGEVCKVTGISEDGVISFRFGGCHLGCMSYGEFEKYFEMVSEEKKSREWTEWKEWHFEYFDPFSRDKYRVFVEYRHNGRKVQMKNEKFKSEATCHKTDKFDLDTGLKLAARRMVTKIVKYDVEKYAKEL